MKLNSLLRMLLPGCSMVEHMFPVLENSGNIVLSLSISFISPYIGIYIFESVLDYLTSF